MNDLYTLTYDEGETLEAVKSIVVNYVSVPELAREMNRQAGREIVR